MQALVDTSVTPTDLIGRVRAARTTADAAEVEILQLAVEWAHAHPELPGDQTWHAPRATAYHDGSPDPGEVSAEQTEWFGIPDVRWDAPAAFAAANAMSTTAGRALIRDALILRHRLPRLYAAVVAGQVTVWRARRVAQAVIGRPADVLTYVDTDLGSRPDRLASLGATRIDRVLDTAMLVLYPEERELEQLAALDARHATLDERTLNHTGLAEMVLRGTWPDLQDFDHALSQVAAALETTLARDGHRESLDVRRSMAVGILADPAAALALLGQDPTWSTKCTRRRAHLVIHLTDLALLGLDPTATDETGRALLDQSVRDWCARPGTQITVRPVLDLATDLPAATPATYRPTATQHEQVALRDRTCVFPWCGRPASRSDLDHLDPWPHGPTDTANLAALCRHHHRLKTHTAWRYTAVEPGTYLWRDPHDQVLLRTRHGTRDLTAMLTTAPGRPQAPGHVDWVTAPPTTSAVSCTGPSGRT